MSKGLKFQSPTGMHDILPSDQPYFKFVLDAFERVVDFYGFSRIETPILEDSGLFEKGTGMSTDIVQKQMYSFRTKGGDYLTLRPEETPCIARAYIQHGMFNLPQPVKLWYFGPFFRYENPQMGRYRQFWQYGLEVIGEQSAIVDAQIISIFYNVFKELKLKDVVVKINSIGDSNCRPYYKKMLISYFKNKEQSLCFDCKRRLRENVLRILDCKNERCILVSSQAPQMIDHLCEQCNNHFKEVLEFLDELEIPYQLDPYLVRGIDYYTKTVFEFVHESGDGKRQGSLGGGGRYDNLLKLIGNRDIPACGGACGVERVINLLKFKKLKIEQEQSVLVFIAQLGQEAKKKSLKITEEFRKEKIKVGESLGKDSLKSQLARADKLGARFTLIIGQKEALEGEVIIRDMVSGRQDVVKIDKVVSEVKKKLKKIK